MLLVWNTTHLATHSGPDARPVNHASQPPSEMGPFLLQMRKLNSERLKHWPKVITAVSRVGHGHRNPRKQETLLGMKGVVTVVHWAWLSRKVAGRVLCDALSGQVGRERDES